MTTHHPKGQKPLVDIDKDTERSIVRYLRDHPDFFERHLDLLADMLLPHDSGSAISLIERQVGILREQKDEHKHKLQQLISIAKTNESLSVRMNELVLTLLDTDSLEQVIDLVQNRLQHDFDADYVTLRLFNLEKHPTLLGRNDITDWSEPVMGAFEKVMAGRKPVCGRLGHGHLESVFNEEKGRIRSAALIPLIANDEPNAPALGLLAIGSLDKDRFRSDMGTLFLNQLGKVLTRVLSWHLNRKIDTKESTPHAQQGSDTHR